MLGRFRAAAKFFTIGLLLGLLFAPEAGQDFRDHLKSRVTGMVRGARPGQ